MNVKQYRQKYNLDKTNIFDRVGFVNDLKNDFLLYIKNLGGMNLNKWKNAIKDILIKYHNIMGNSLSPGETEKFWKYIYAVVIIPERKRIFGKDFKEVKLQYRLKTDPDFKIRYNMWKMLDEMEEILGEIWEKKYRDFHERTFYSIKSKGEIFNEEGAKGILGIPMEIPIDISVIKFAYREKAKIFHPDMGGEAEEFLKIQKAREYLEKIIGDK